MKITKEAPVFTPITITLETPMDLANFAGLVSFVVHESRAGSAIERYAMQVRDLLGEATNDPSRNDF